MKLTLTSIQRYDKDKGGLPLKTRDNRPYTRLVIRVKEYGEKQLSGFDNPQTQNWKEGDEIEAEVEQKGEYLNFKLPKKEDKVAEALERILVNQTKILLGQQEIANYLQTNLKSVPTYPKRDESNTPKDF